MYLLITLLITVPRSLLLLLDLTEKIYIKRVVSSNFFDFLKGAITAKTKLTTILLYYDFCYGKHSQTTKILRSFTIDNYLILEELSENV